jgi:hypothetical protein
MRSPEGASVFMCELVDFPLAAAGWIQPFGMQGLPVTMTGSLKYRSRRFPSANMGKPKMRFPEQSKRYQADVRLSTKKAQKRSRIDRKYDMSILGNIYICLLLSLAGVETTSMPGLTLLYKAIYWIVSRLQASCSSVEVPLLASVVTVLSLIFARTNPTKMMIHCRSWDTSPTNVSSASDRGPHGSQAHQSTYLRINQMADFDGAMLNATRVNEIAFRDRQQAGQPF